MPKCLIVLLLISFVASGQKFSTSSGTISFFSKAAIEDIEAINSKSSALLDLSSGNLAVLLLINDFQFDNSLMQEHFNEKYMESHKFPRATFKGLISGYDVAMKGQQSCVAKGQLTIHGKTNSIEASGTVNLYDNSVQILSTFPVRLEDYNIKIPRLLWQNIAEVVEVRINLTLVPK